MLVPRKKSFSDHRLNSSIGITGGTGFIGSHVRKEFDYRGIPLTILGRQSAQNMTLRTHEQYMECDIREPNILTKESVPQTLIHLAWTGLVDFTSESHLAEELHVQSNFLKSVVQLGVQNLLVSGTCFEYGLVEGEIGEDCATRPVVPYAIAKNELREMLIRLQVNYEYNLMWARLFYVYGDGQRSSTLYSGIMKAIASGAASLEVSSKNLVRDFISVENVAKYLTDLALLNSNCGQVNVCSGTGTSVGEFVDQIAAREGVQLSVVEGNRPLPNFEPESFWGNSSLLRKLID